MLCKLLSRVTISQLLGYLILVEQRSCIVATNSIHEESRRLRGVGLARAANATAMNAAESKSGEWDLLDLTESDMVVPKTLPQEYINNDLRHDPYHRAMIEEHNFFAPLTCNQGFSCPEKKSNWTLEQYNPDAGMVVIPCGHCILLDYMLDQVKAVDASANWTLQLAHGIDIQGYLHIPGNAYGFNRLTILTPFVRVQGKLTIDAQHSLVGAVPNVRIVLTSPSSPDDSGISFLPAANNEFACSETTSDTQPMPCTVGSQSIAVPGGQLDIQGLPRTCSTWVHLYDDLMGNSSAVSSAENLGNSIVVRNKGVIGCWGQGAEILITSHTTDFESAQRRRLVSDPQRYRDGLVRLMLDEPILPTITEQHDALFAVEVVLLSRNIVFEAAINTADRLLGGHLIVMNTPNVPQLLQGVEILNFGRQGELGRYPIHFHLCGNVYGSMVAKNSIRNSNQRCVVVHGTHNLTVSNNVAYETFGHCFMLEDGGEMDNTFVGNIGAGTRAAERLTRPFESDGRNPSTFWCSNPLNRWINNVAAGSESSGFWFELQREVRPPTSLLASSEGLVPRRLPLKQFLNNVAHSNVKHGLRTYPSGFEPPVQATFHNTRSYKNREAGVFFHETADVKFQGGVLADNRIQADFDRVDNVVINGTSVFGSTVRYNEIVASEPARFGHAEFVVGIQLHSFTLDRDKSGAKIANLRFSGFTDAITMRSVLIDIDDDKRSGHFDYWTSLRSVTVADGPGVTMFDFRASEAAGVVDVYLIDVDGSMNPTESTQTVRESGVISASPQMTAFIDAQNCIDFSTQGYLYCPNTCFRSVTYATSPAETSRFILRVSDVSNPSKSFDFPGFYHFETEETDGQSPEQRNTWILKHRYFAPSLPAGSYAAQFVDTSTGEVSWPTFVETTFERKECSFSLTQNPVILDVPAPSQSQCLELVRNGDMEASDSAYPHWLHAETGIELVVGGGLDGTNAISDTVHDVHHAYIGQFIDTRCLQEGRQYNVRAWIKLVNPTSNAIFLCDREDSSCPSVVLRYRVAADTKGRSFDEEQHTVAFKVKDTQNGWRLFQETVTVDARLASASSVALVAPRGMANIKMYLDNISMSLVS